MAYLDPTDTVVNQQGGPAEVLLPGALVAGRYQVLSLLGSGGMGSVYKVADQHLNEVVALKLLSPTADGLSRLRSEVRLARLVTHKNVARTYDIGEDASTGQVLHFLTMELIEGRQLSTQLREQGALPLLSFLDLAEQICAGLQAAHKAGVVHRDLKPENIMVCSDGRAVLTDFGIACLNRQMETGGDPHGKGPRSFTGTPMYMAPEQIGSCEVDARADLYALGCVLYEMCAGQPAWSLLDESGNVNIQALLFAKITQDPPPLRKIRPYLDEDLCNLIGRLLSRDPASRPKAAGEVERFLSALRSTTTGLSTPLGLAGLATTKEPGQTEGRALLVLPFRNLGPKEDDYLAEGLTEDLTDTLSISPALRVRPPGAARRLRQNAPDADARELGQALSVDLVVEGSVRHVANVLRVQTRLIGVADGYQIWADRRDRASSEVLHVSDEIARAIQAALTVPTVASHKAAPTDPRALDLYLRARHEYNKPDRNGVARSIGLFQEARKISPQDPAILVGEALAQCRHWFFGGEGAEVEATKAAQRAIAVAPDRPEAHLAIAAVRLQSGDPAAAVRDLRQIIKRAPALAEAYDMLGRVLVEVGPVVDGMSALTTALSLDPGLYLATIALARCHGLRGEWRTAYQLLEQIATIDLATGYFLLLSRFLLWQGDRLRARQMLSHPDVSAGRYPRALPILQAAADPRGPLDLSRIQAITGASARNRVFAAQLRCEIAGARGLIAMAQDALDEAVKEGLLDLLWLDACPVLAPLRGTGRFVLQRSVVVQRAKAVLS